MTNGSLDIFWETNSTPTETRAYRLVFLPYSSPEHGAVPFKRIVGEENLHAYLFDLLAPNMSAERRQDRVREWLLQLHSRTSLSLDNMWLTEEQASEFLRAATA